MTNWDEIRAIFEDKSRDFEDLPGVIVPFGTDGKIRAGRVHLIEKVSND